MRHYVCDTERRWIMYSKLQKIIETNAIDEDELFKSVYSDIRESILREICEYMKADDRKRIEVKKIYRRCSDNNAATTIVLRNICHLKLPDDDVDWLTSCITAFFRKKPHRVPIANSTKKELLQSQNYKCAICGKPIDNYSLHVDHIVPWDYVGDELNNNYQALCPSCNGHKSNHVAESVKNLIISQNKGKE